MTKTLLLGMLALLILAYSPVRSQDMRAAQRWALVVGNGEYANEMLHLTNPPVDADAIASALEKLGYTVIHKDNLTKAQLADAIRSFGANLQKGGSGLFYYAGHAYQLNGNNYLLPIDASFTNPTDLLKQAVPLDSVLDVMQMAHTSPNIIILDSCRNNPFVQPLDRNDWVKGLAPPKNAPPDTLIAFATNPGNTADDGIGKHSPYTRALLKYIGVPGMSVEDLFKDVRALVEASTDDQVPWENTSLKQPFVFRPPIAIRAKILDGDDDVFVFLNGLDVMSWGNDGNKERRVLLKAGDNQLAVKVYNQRTFTGGIEGLGGHLPEGWRYAFVAATENGSTLLNLKGGEDRPVQDGPHHGHLFTVATAELNVDDDGFVTLSHLDPGVWTHEVAAAGDGSSVKAPAHASQSATTTPADMNLTVAAQAHIDWCIRNETHDSGETNCVREYISTERGCILGGGRACLLEKAIAAAKSNNCEYAFKLTLMCQCHNPAAQAVLQQFGREAVCTYLKTK